MYEDKYICLVISTPKTIVMLWKLELYTAFVINNTYYFSPILFVLPLFGFYALSCFCVSVFLSLCLSVLGRLNSSLVNLSSYHFVGGRLGAN